MDSKKVLNTFAVNRKNPKWFLSDKKLIVILAIVFGLALIVYHQIFYAQYVFSDSSLLMETHENIIYDVSKNGRYLQGVFFKLIYSPQSLDVLIWGRVFSLFSWLFAIICYVGVYKKIKVRLVDEDYLFLFLSSMLILFNLSTGIYIGWVACFQVGIAFILSLFSGFFFLISFQNKGLIAKYGVMALSFVLMFLSLSTYQISATAFLIPLYFFWRIKEDKNVVCSSLVAFFVFLAGYFALFKFISFSLGMQSSGRGQLVSDILGKVIFFLGEPLSNSLKWVWFPFQMENVKWITISILGLLLVIIPLITKVALKRVFGRVLVLAIFLILSYLPQLLISENWASYRSTGMLLCASAILFSDVLILNPFFNSKIKLVIVILVSSIIVFKSYLNFNQHFIDPNIFEFKRLVSEIKTKKITENDDVLILKSNWSFFRNKFGYGSVYDEYSIPSTFIKWSTIPIFKKAAQESGMSLENVNSLNIRIEYFGYKVTKADSSYVVFDMDDILSKD